MQHVFTDISTIAHMWANQTQHDARNGRNFYFTGNTIYSYGSHFPIAKHIEHNGEKAVLFTERTYSNTTAKQIHVVKYACSHKNIIYCYSPDSTHDENFAHWISTAEVIADNLKKARKPELYLTQIKQIQNRVEKYATFFGVPIPETLKALFNVQNKQEYREYTIRKSKLIAAEAKAKAARAKREYKKELKEWLQGEGKRMYNRLDGLDYLRKSAHTTRHLIETTQGVVINYTSAYELWDKIVKADGQPVSFEWADYHVVSDKEMTKIGCHNFKTAYLIEFGKRLFNKTAV